MGCGASSVQTTDEVSHSVGTSGTDTDDGKHSGRQVGTVSQLGKLSYHGREGSSERFFREREALREAKAQSHTLERADPTFAPFSRFQDLDVLTAETSHVLVHAIVEAHRHHEETKGASLRSPKHKVTPEEEAANDFAVAFSAFHFDRASYAVANEKRKQAAAARAAASSSSSSSTSTSSSAPPASAT